MNGYYRDLALREKELLNEISGMKFSFRKIMKIVELESVLELRNK